MEPTRRKLCFLDDNFFACSGYKKIIDEVKNTNKPFQFKQGLDERLITTEKALDMSSWKYDGDFIFAFDNIEDKYMIIDKLRILNEFLPAKQKKFYVFCGFDRENQYGNDFFEQDIEELFERISILKRYKALPYIMRHENYIKSPYSWLYAQFSAWCNQPSLFKTFDFETFVKCRAMGNKYSKYKRDIDGYLSDGNKKNKTWLEFEKFKVTHKDLFEKYFN